MRVLLQRVSSASVSVENQCIASINQGLLLLCGVAEGDELEQIKAMAAKVTNLRIFPDEKGRFQHSILDLEAEALLVPQFTLFADTSKGRRPEFFGAMKPPKASELFDEFAGELVRRLGVKNVETGEFGANMQVSLVNDGPVTLMLEI